MLPKIKEIAKAGFRVLGIEFRMAQSARQESVPLEDQEAMVEDQLQVFKAVTGRDYETAAETRYSVDNEYEVIKPFGDPQGLSGDLLIAAGTMIKLLNLPPGAAVLDLGCGCGWTSNLLARCGFHVTGVDVNAASLAIGQRNADAAGLAVKFINADMQTFTLDQCFDAVVIFDSLHHCLREQSVLSNVERMLIPGGKIVLCEQSYPDEEKAGLLTHDDAIQTMRRHGTLEKGLGTKYLVSALLGCGFDAITVFTSQGHYRRWHIARKSYEGVSEAVRSVINTSDFAVYDSNDEAKMNVLEKKLKALSPDNPIVYESGWYNLEVNSEADLKQWRWMAKEAKCLVNNPKRDALLVIRGSVNLKAVEDQKVIFKINDMVLAEFIPKRSRFEKSYYIKKEMLGDNAEFFLTISTDKSFVPARIFPGSKDRRELGMQISLIYMYNI